MNTFIEAEKIDILGRNYESNDNNEKGNRHTTNEEGHEEMKDQQSGWKKFSSRVKEVWSKVKPIISGMTTFFTIATAFVKSITKFGMQCKNMKTVFA